jgi:hypothetical protein
MHRILAHRVTPDHVAPVDSLRIVLGKQVIFTGVKHQAVGIIDPVGGRRKLELRPQSYSGFFFGRPGFPIFSRGTSLFLIMNCLRYNRD